MDFAPERAVEKSDIEKRAGQETRRSFTFDDLT